MTASAYATAPLEPDDIKSGFSCGKPPLDSYFRRHALDNQRTGIGRTYVLRGTASDSKVLPRVLGFYTLSMANAESAQVAEVLAKTLPKYPMPVALIGRLAVDKRAQGKRLGEKLLMDALHRVMDAAAILGCMGIIVDAKDADAERFYKKYDFVTVSADGWPRRMFLPISVVREAFAEPDSEREVHRQERPSEAPPLQT